MNIEYRILITNNNINKEKVKKHLRFGFNCIIIGVRTGDKQKA